MLESAFVSDFVQLAKFVALGVIVVYPLHAEYVEGRSHIPKEVEVIMRFSHGLFWSVPKLAVPCLS